MRRKSEDGMGLVVGGKRIPHSWGCMICRQAVQKDLENCASLDPLIHTSLLGIVPNVYTTHDPKCFREILQNLRNFFVASCCDRSFEDLTISAVTFP